MKNKKVIPRFYLSLIIIAAFIILIERAGYIYPPIISLSLFAAVFGALLMLSGRCFFALASTSTLVIIAKFFNQLKIHYYKEQLLFADLKIAVDPANMGTLGQYWVAGLAVGGLFIWLIINMIIGWKVSTKGRLKTRFVGLLLIILGSIATYSCAQYVYKKWQETLPKGTGTLSNLVISAQNSQYSSPEFEGSPDYFLSQMGKVTLPTPQQQTKPDIVLLLQESTVDPKIYQLPAEHKLPSLFMFQNDENVKAQGPMRVQTFGGGTWLSEFAALSGLNSDDFGTLKNSVFYFVVDHLNHSLFKEMKDNGYYTIVFTSFNRSAYHSGHAYETLGVDKIIQPQDLGYPADKNENLWHIPTAEMLTYIKEIMATETDKPLFIYSLTMSEHGPYEESHGDDYQLTESLGKTVAGQLSHYVSKIADSDNAIKDFSQFVAQRDKPTMFLYFGDHQPNVGVNDYQINDDNPQLISQFTLRDNLVGGQNIHSTSLTDISFLGGIILERAQLKASPFYQANMAMRHLCDGQLEDCQDTQLIKSYKNYIYQYLNAANK